MKNIKEESEKNNSINEFDLIKLELPINVPKKSKVLGMEVYPKANGNSIVIISGKSTATSTKFGGITTANLDVVADKLSELTNTSISKDLILNSPVFKVDVKKDVIVDNPTETIANIKEIALGSTLKKDIITYGDKNSVVIKPNVCAILDSFTVYIKYNEIKNNRKSPAGREYFDLLDKNFLEENKNTVRFERRLANFKALRKAFHTNEKKLVVGDLLYSETDVVTEYIEELTERGM